MRKEELSAHIHDIGGFDRVQLAEAECGRVLLKLDVPDTMLNVYGIVHGGRRTAVNRISIYDGARRLLATADFTMFRRDEPAR